MSESSVHPQFCKKEVLYVPALSATMGPKCSLDLRWNFTLLSFSVWPWRRWKDFNPQWNVLIPATCHHVHWLHTDEGASQRAPSGRQFSFDWQGESPHHSTNESNNTTSGFISAWNRDGWSCWQCKFWPAWGGGIFWKSPQCFCVAEGASIEGAIVAGAAPMLFLFSALRTFGICVGPHKEIPQLHFPRSPSPPLEPARLPHICIKMKSCRDKMSLPYSSGCRRGHFHISGAYFHDLL